jgi:hypothetical protein
MLLKDGGAGFEIKLLFKIFIERERAQYDYIASLT